MKVSFTLNGRPVSVEAAPGENAQKLLKRMGIPSVRNSDDSFGFAGSDTIIMDGRIVGSSLLVAPMLEGREVKTVESLSAGARGSRALTPEGNRNLSLIQQALVDAGCIQSGYNAPAAALMLADLLERSPRPSKTEIIDALSGLFNRATGYRQFFDAVDLAVKRRENPESRPVQPSFRAELTLVGKPAAKQDAPRLVAGEKAYVEDRVEQNACLLKILRSPYAHALVLDIDTAEAEQVPGVVAVFTHKNVPDIYMTHAGQGFPEPSAYDAKLIGQKVRHVGDRVAAVVAETEEAAREALKKIRVRYQVLPPVMTIDQALAPDAPAVQGGIQEFAEGAPDDLAERNRKADPREGKIIFQFPIGADPGRNIAASVSGGIGDMEKGFDESEVILERTYETSQVQCTPLETHSAYARIEGDRLVLHASTQVPFHVRRLVARLLSLPENRVRVIKERIGGGYGSKQDIFVEDLCAWAAWNTGRPVFIQHTREEEFISCSTRKPMRIKVKIGALKDGTLKAVSMSILSNQGPYGAHSLTVPMNACSKSLPLFLCDNFHFDVTSLYSNIPPTGAYQGYGAPKGSYALQTAVKELAVELGMDHMELVEKNRVREGSVLEILRCLGEGREGTAAPAASCGLEQALARGRELIEWGKPVTSPDPDIRIGKGFAIIQQGSGLPGLDQANATLKMLGDGTFVLHSGGADLGTGLDMVCAKMAAEILKIDLGVISVTSGDTDMTPFDKGAYASSGTYFSGGAARNAALKMKDQILAESARILGVDAGDLELVYPAQVRSKTGETLSFARLAWHTQAGEGSGQLIASASFTTNDAAFPYGAHFCQVKVNTRTGKIGIDKYFALQDCGTPINPEYALGQIYGGVLKSIGHTLYEQMQFDAEGRCLTTDLRSYGVPSVGDLPEELVCELIPTDDPFGPFGAKSIAEISVNGAAPAIANAVHDAVGVWIRSWPFSPEKVLNALDEAASSR